MLEAFKNLLLQNQLTDGLETLYAGLSTRVPPRLFKRLPRVDLELFYGQVKYGKMIIDKISSKDLKILA